MRKFAIPTVEDLKKITCPPNCPLLSFETVDIGGAEKRLDYCINPDMCPEEIE